jgi:hypothetical protein
VERAGVPFYSRAPAHDGQGAGGEDTSRTSVVGWSGGAIE